MLIVGDVANDRLQREGVIVIYHYRAHESQSTAWNDLIVAMIFLPPFIARLFPSRRVAKGGLVIY